MHSSINSRNTVVLLLGDIIVYAFSLALTLFIRYGEIPSRHLLLTHVPAFSVLIVVFLLVHMSAGLYDNQSGLVRNRTNGLILNVQIINIILGAMFFYFAPVAISPKANLFIYFVVATLLMYLWRTVMVPVISSTRKQPAIIVGAGSDLDDLCEEINNNSHYSLFFKDRIKPEGSIQDIVSKIDVAVKTNNSSIIVADLHDKNIEAAIPFMYSLIFSGVRIVDASRLYESVFDRIPVTLVGERWLVENSSTALGRRSIYDALKRAMDIIISAGLGFFSLVLYPFVYLAIKIEDKGAIFIQQDRIGMNGKPVKIIKFRSMSGNDGGVYGTDGTTKLVVTKVGRFLRDSRVDELPQLWNVLKGDLSLIGPRPELPTLVSVYDKQVPYYNARHLVKPGLSGWAQIYHQKHPHHEVDSIEAKNKLYYDLYYIKNRSFLLDLKIALRTMQTLLSRVGK